MSGKVQMSWNCSIAQARFSRLNMVADKLQQQINDLIVARESIRDEARRLFDSEN